MDQTLLKMLAYIRQLEDALQQLAQEKQALEQQRGGTVPQADAPPELEG